MAKGKTNFTSADLKNLLWETMNNLTTGKIVSKDAQSIATQAREILRTEAIKLAIARQSRRKLAQSSIDFAEDN